jgi:hypothetical protein
VDGAVADKCDLSLKMSAGEGEHVAP